MALVVLFGQQRNTQPPLVGCPKYGFGWPAHALANCSVAPPTEPTLMNCKADRRTLRESQRPNTMIPIGYPPHPDRSFSCTIAKPCKKLLTLLLIPL